MCLLFLFGESPLALAQVAEADPYGSDPFGEKPTAPPSQTAPVDSDPTRPRTEMSFELRSMSNGSRPALTVVIPDASEKLALAEWRKLMKSYDAKVKRSKPERARSEGVVIRSIGGSDPIDLYADFSARGSEVKVYVWMRHRGLFLSEESAVRDVEQAAALLDEFALQVQRASVQQQLDDEARTLKQLEKRLASLESKHRSHENAIARAERAIIEAREAIVTNLEDQATTQSEIERQTEEVEAVRRRLEALGETPK